MEEMPKPVDRSLHKMRPRLREVFVCYVSAQNYEAGVSPRY